MATMDAGDAIHPERTTEERLRQKAWDNAVHAEGTRFVFDVRSKKLASWTEARDFTGIAVPIILAYIYGSEQFEALKPYKNFIIAILAFIALIQLLLTVLSLIKRWDNALAYNIRAVRDQYELRTEWVRIAEGNTTNLNLDFDRAMIQQKLYESHDSLQGITRKEEVIGLRAGLFLFRRPCVCLVTPRSIKQPFFAWDRCEYCGSNIGRKTDERQSQTDSAGVPESDGGRKEGVS